MTEHFASFNGHQVAFEPGQTILQVAKANDIFIPTLCAYLPLNHTPGTCRMCLVEVFEGDNPEGRVVTACTTPIREGQRIFTRNERVRKMQQLQMELLFADHDQDCKSCSRHGDCELQDVSLFIGMKHWPRHKSFIAERPYDDSSAGIIRDVNKCIRCGRCVEVCRQVQGIGALTIDEFGTRSGVAMTGAKRWADSAKCIQCGQCTLVCPTGALSEKDETDRVLNMIDDPNLTTIVQMAPSVRVTLGEEFGAKPGENIEGKIIYALKHIGVDYVMDTNFAADMVIMEEGTELLERLKKRKDGGEVALPMFTSCCPGWVNYVEKHLPMVMEYLSSTRSPQAVFGALAKEYLPAQLGVKRENVRVISIMPCTAKKGEAGRDTLKRADGSVDVDAVLTVRELAKLMRRCGTHLKFCQEAAYDNELFASYSGAGAIFGTTGGVMEAAVRTAYALTHNGQSMNPIVFTPVRGIEGLKESVVDLGELGSLRLAVVHGIARTQALLDRMSRGEVMYDFVEVMACPGGCVAGGGTPRKKNNYQPYLKQRQEALYTIDAKAAIRESHKNPQVIAMYKEHLGEPGSHVAHELLHCEYRSKKREKASPEIRKLWQKLSHRYTQEAKKR